MSMGFFAAGANGGGATAPLVETIGSSLTPAGTVVPVQMPAVVNAGDLLIVTIAIAGSNGSTSASGWTQFVNGVGGASVITARCFRKIAAGTEGGTIVNFTMSSSRIASAICHRIKSGDHDPATAPVGAGVNQASTSTQNPPNLTPSWGSANNIWLAVALMEDNFSITAYPYPSGNFNQRTDPGVSSRSQSATCYIQTTASSLDPPAYTIANSVTGYPITIAIKPL